MRLRAFFFAALATAGLLLIDGSAFAQGAVPPQGVVTLGASATTEVAHDLMNLTLSTRREGADANAVQQQLKQALDAALAQARAATRPGQLDVRTGAFNIGVRYTANGVANGWQGSAELLLEGRDMAAIGQLAGRIGTMTVARVGYDLSRELRARVEGDVTAQAIALFQARAADCARQFGYAGYAIREVAVNAEGGAPYRPIAMAAMKAMAEPNGGSALPVEAGRGTITVMVNGSVQMTR